MSARAIGAGAFQVPAQRARAPHQVNRRAVPCPDCKAETDAPCLSVNGKVLTASHRSRVRMATRKYLADREAENAAKL